MTSDLAGAIAAAAGLLFIAAVNIVMTRRTAAGTLTRNHVIGIRTPATMRDDASWQIAHTAAAPALQGATVVALVFVPIVLLARVGWLSTWILLAPALLMIVGGAQGHMAARRHQHG